MNNWKRLVYYLLINVIVSACTILVVLFAWERAHNRSPQDLFSFSLPDALSANAAGETDSSSGAVHPAENAPQDVPEYTVYQVKEYDTFESIAQTFGVTVEELISINGFTVDQPLGPGEALLIPVREEPASTASVEIAAVLGAGDLATERVVLRQSGAGEVSLAGWSLEDSSGNSFLFPALELSRDGYQVEVYTKAGVNTPVTLYWSLDKAVWQTGETVYLRDEQGVLRAELQIP